MIDRLLHAAAVCLALGMLPAAVHAQEMRPFVHGSWQAIRAAHADRPTIVHFWGITCAPCRTEMPVWGALITERPDLELVTVHADRAPPQSSQMIEMLRAAGLQKAEAWWFADRFAARLRYEVDPQWQGEMPMTLLISRGGDVETIIGSATRDQIVAWLDAQAGPHARAGASP